MQSSPKIAEALSLGTVYPEEQIHLAVQEPELNFALQVKVRFPWLDEPS